MKTDPKLGSCKSNQFNFHLSLLIDLGPKVTASVQLYKNTELVLGVTNTPKILWMILHQSQCWYSLKVAFFVCYEGVLFPDYDKIADLFRFNS